MTPSLHINKVSIFCALAALCCPLSLAASKPTAPPVNTQTAADIQLEVSIHPAEGFMDGGWGNINFKFINAGKKNVTVQSVSGDWMMKDKVMKHWQQTPALNMQNKAQVVHKVTSCMYPNAKKMSEEQGAVPHMAGEVTLSDGQIIAYSIDIPVAELSTPIKAIKGKYISVNLQESSWASVKNPQKIVNYLDETYQHMQELTGNTPFGGKTSVILEAPRNPYFAYAGNPIVLNTQFVPNSVKEMDQDQLCFGWVHEMGHTFDNGIGQWYNYAGFTEMQANFKLSYAAEMMCTKDSTYKIKSWKDKKSLLTGREFNDEQFMPFADKYLSSDKEWVKMVSSEHHALFLTVIRKEGWQVAKKFYRVYIELAKSKMKAPQGEDKLKLLYAVLDHCTESNLAPLYAKWRIPLNEKDIKVLLAKYKIQ